MYTEKEAKTKWCPMVRNMAVESSNYDGEFQGVATINTGGKNKCIASNCMMWRWEYESDDIKERTNKGSCGLTGRI